MLRVVRVNINGGCKERWFRPQYTEESLGQAEKTEVDPGLDELFARVDATKRWTDQIISQTEVLLQPNSGEKIYLFLLFSC